MTPEQFKSAWEAIEKEVISGRMTSSGGMARVTLLAFEYANNNIRSAGLTREAIYRGGFVKEGK